MSPNKRWKLGIVTVALIFASALVSFIVTLIHSHWDAAVQAFGTIVGGTLAIAAAGVGAWGLLRQSQTQRDIAREQAEARATAALNALLAEVSMIEEECKKFRASYVVRWEHEPRRVMGFIVPIPDLLRVYFREGLTLDKVAAAAVASLVFQLHHIAEIIRMMSEDTAFSSDEWKLSCDFLADQFEQAGKNSAAVIAELEALIARQASSRRAQ